jgi:wobble nucleotide-excising tRNase
MKYKMRLIPQKNRSSDKKKIKARTTEYQTFLQGYPAEERKTTMIIKFDAKKFGSFKNFQWDSSVKDSNNTTATFKKLNIIYGKNFSGKTTLSRVVRSLETKELPAKYTNPEFIVTTDNGTISSTNLSTAPDNIRVYNKDFVDKHLGFLRDEENNISPFAVIGIENNTIVAQIKEEEVKLGSIDEKCGLHFEYSVKNKEVEAKNKEHNKSVTDLDKKLSQKATQAPNGIKHNSIFKDPNYNITKIQNDVKTVLEENYTRLDDNARDQKRAILRDTPLADITINIYFSSRFAELKALTESLISKDIKPTQPMQDLLDDALLQAWVKQGMTHHKDKRSTCAFCRQDLPKKIWEQLENHFSKEATELEGDLNKAISDVEEEETNITSLVIPKADQFYSSIQAQYKTISTQLEKETKSYISNIKILKNALVSRLNDIYKKHSTEQTVDNTQKILDAIASITSLANEHNNKTSSLSKEQDLARKELRLDEISLFVESINYKSEQKHIAKLKQELVEVQNQEKLLKEQIDDINRQLDKLKSELKDEKKGADTVNKVLSHYFGHKGLHLKAIEQQENFAYKFQVFRGEEPAYNLSEGECSLVAFCYFIAKLEEPETAGKKLILFIDDPISSLDGNHIFFIYSLIEKLLARPQEDDQGNIIIDANKQKVYNYEQLFISTHNLEFLKFLKRIAHPKKNHEHFQIVSADGESSIHIMPNYLKKYVTELNYLFGEICICADSKNATKNHNSFYNFGNNLRKFLEAFLFFKYPSVGEKVENDQNLKLKWFFGDDLSADSLIQGIANQYSHLLESIDRGSQPIDKNEIETTAKYVLLKIKEHDAIQYKCFLESVEQNDPHAI